LSPDSSGILQVCPRRIEDDEPDWSAVASGTSPGFWVRSPSALVESMARGQDIVFAAAMAFIGCHEADRAVSMFVVIPADEAPTHRGAD